MIWLSIVVILLAVMLVKLGALSVLVTVLSVAFKAAIVVIAVRGFLFCTSSMEENDPSQITVHHRRPKKGGEDGKVSLFLSLPSLIAKNFK